MFFCIWSCPSGDSSTTTLGENPCGGTPPAEDDDEEPEAEAAASTLAAAAARATSTSSCSSSMAEAEEATLMGLADSGGGEDSIASLDTDPVTYADTREELF